MNNLSEVMQARLDKWRNKAVVAPSADKVRGKHLGKGDYGDVQSMEDWELEILNSQRRK
jgi:hypothetical protein